MNTLPDLQTHGWCRFGFDAELSDWVQAIKPAALQAASDPEAQADWLRHGKTWFAGVNILPNDGRGAVGSSGPLRGAAVSYLQGQFGLQDWDKAQVSVIYPGYPKQDAQESDAAHRFRKNRDAAHVDGLLPIGPDRRRYMQEPHAFVLGIPLNHTDAQASPMVVWEGSHLIMQRAFRKALEDVAPDKWSEVDLTEAYHTARKVCFDTCTRVVVHANPGEAYVIHRLALHGVAPWQDGATAPPEGRMIAYFRPENRIISDWLSG